MSESNKWFRDKWNRLDKLKWIEDNWFDFFNRRIKDLFSDYLDRMNMSNKEDEKLFLEINNKRIRVNKKF